MRRGNCGEVSGRTLARLGVSWDHLGLLCLGFWVVCVSSCSPHILAVLVLLLRACGARKPVNLILCRLASLPPTLRWRGGGALVLSDPNAGHKNFSLRKLAQLAHLLKFAHSYVFCTTFCPRLAGTINQHCVKGRSGRWPPIAASPGVSTIA